eukprot:jgi/Mesvir1/19254/Mv10336-RA.1
MFPVAEIARLPESEPWACYVHKLRCWIPLVAGEPAESEDGEHEVVARPWLILVLDTAVGSVLGSTEASHIVKSREPPTAEAVVDFLAAVMLAPKVTGGGLTSLNPSRPRKILFADFRTADGEGADKCSLVDACRPTLQKAGIECSYAPIPPSILTDVIRGRIEKALPSGGGPMTALPGLEEEGGFNLEFGESLFRHAVSFYSAVVERPGSIPELVKLSYTIHDDGQNKVRAQGFALFKRMVEEDAPDAATVGLSLYKTEQLARDALAGAEADGGQCCAFLPETEVPFADLDAVDKWHWPITSGGLYPVFFRALCQDGTVYLTRPDLINLQCFEFALQVLASARLTFAPGSKHAVTCSTRLGGENPPITVDIEVL